MKTHQTLNDVCEVQKCRNPVIAENRCILHHLNNEKDKEVFEIAIKNKLNQKDFNFREVCFIGQVSFAGKKLENADFSGAVFDEADFSGTQFVGRANFNFAQFNSSANFSDAIFLKDTDFSASRFYNRKEAVFRNTSFNGAIDFTGAWFTGNSNFFRAKFCDKAKFIETRFLQSCDFRFVEIVGDDKLVFQDLSMDILLSGTDLRRVQLLNVEWPVYYGRNVVYDERFLHYGNYDIGVLYQGADPYDEVIMRKAKIYPYIERLYRYLKLNYEVEGDLKSSGDFHYGEMEMHRKARIWRWFPFYWYNIYRISSGYGERPLRALLFFSILILAFAYAILWFDPDGFMGSDQKDLWNAILYVFQQGTFQKPDWFKPSTEIGKLLSTIIAFILPGQAALFMLALRNRLGRRR
jgi:uncharacterized protein YjbI with pentapeptide repeats